MKTYKLNWTLLVLLFINHVGFAQTYTSWDEVDSKRFGKETIFTSISDRKPLNGDYKISEKSGAYADIQFKNGKINGSYISYDSNGKKMSEANYKEGKIEGKQTSYFQNGKIEEETFYKNGLKEGAWLTYNKEGKKIREENYKNDQKEGKWIKILKTPQQNTTSKVIEFYKNNDPTGTWEERLTDGKLKWERRYSAPTDYSEKRYFPNGKVSSEEIIKKRKKNGVASYFSPEGLLQHKINFNNDHIVYKEEYFENGILKKKTSYKYGAINGPYELYNEEGIKIKEGNRKNTYKEGIWKVYEGKKGRLFSEITYKNDKENGLGKFYNTDAKRLEREGKYLNGKKDGIWKHYDMAGELAKEIEYKKGRKVSVKKYN